MRLLLRFLIVLALVGVALFLYLGKVSGQFKDIEVVEQGACRVIEGVVGVEDIDQHRGAQIAFLSSDDRAAAVANRPHSGGIFSLDLSDPEALPILLTADHPELRPHGISLVETGLKTGVLYVVDHGDAERRTHSIVVFDFDGQRLSLRDRVVGSELISPNDVAGLSDGTFYVTNDHGSRGAAARMAEDFLRVGGGNVLYHDAGGFEVVADDVLYANGIAVDEDAERVYVASTTTGRVLVYQRRDDGGLDPLEVVETETGVDNIELDRFGNLWIAAHPKLLTFTRHAGNPALRSPSEALWIAKDKTTEPRIRTLWRNEGEMLSGSSVIVPVGARFLVGSVFEPHILECRREF